MYAGAGLSSVVNAFFQAALRVLIIKKPGGKTGRGWNCSQVAQGVDCLGVKGISLLENIGSSEQNRNLVVGGKGEYGFWDERDRVTDCSFQFF